MLVQPTVTVRRDREIGKADVFVTLTVVDQIYLRIDDPKCLEAELVALIESLVTASPACRARVRAVLNEG